MRYRKDYKSLQACYDVIVHDKNNKNGGFAGSSVVEIHGSRNWAHRRISVNLKIISL